MLLPFIKSKNGIDDVDISVKKCELLNARTLQVIQASVTQTVSHQIQHAKSSYEAFCTSEKMYSMMKMLDFMELRNRFEDIWFKVGYDPHRFVADFDNIIEDFQLAGTTFSDPFIATTFLQKLPNIHEPGTVYSFFYHTVTSVAEMKKYEELKLIFVQLDHNSARNNKDKSKMNETSNDTPGKKHQILTNSITNIAASIQSTPSSNSKN